MPIAIKVPVWESERGWGQKLDDYMVCISIDEAKTFIKEFNAKNNEPSVPDYYMWAKDELIPMDLTDNQFAELKANGRLWLQQLNKIK